MIISKLFNYKLKLASVISVGSEGKDVTDDAKEQVPMETGDPVAKVVEEAKTETKKDEDGEDADAVSDVCLRFSVTPFFNFFFFIEELSLLGSPYKYLWEL